METQTSKETRKSFLGFSFWTGLLLLAGIGLTVWGWNTLQNARASTAWPTTDGVVIKSEVTQSMDDEGRESYSPRVSYSYTVNDIVRTNNTIKFSDTSYNDLRKAQEVTGNYSVGKNIVVHYDPESPGNAVLEPGVSGGSYIVLTFGVLLVLIALANGPLSFFFGNKT